MKQLLARDLIRGQTGVATININGNIEEMFYLKNLDANVEKNKDTVRTIGKFGDQHKSNGFNGTGTMTIHTVTSIFRRMMLDFVKNGVDQYFTITTTNEDPNSTVGAQTTVLHNCNLDSVNIANIDIDENSLEEEVSFTFDDYDLLEEFRRPSNM